MNKFTPIKLLKKAGLTSCLFLWFYFSAINCISKQPDPWKLDKSLETAYNHTLFFEFGLSRQLLDKYTDTHYGKIYLQHLNDALQLFLTEKESELEAFEAITETRIELIESGPPNPYQNFFLSEIKIHLTFLELKFGHELSAAWNFRQAYRATKKNVSNYPDFLLNKKSLGLQHIIIGSAPERHQWLLQLLGFDGTIEKGLNELSEFSQSNSIYKIENDVILAFIYSYLLQESNRGLQVLKSYQSILQSNQLVNFAQASLLIKNSQSDSAYHVLNNFNPSQQAQPFPYSEFMKGSVLMEKGDYAEATNHFEEFLDKYNGKNNIKDAHYKLGICNWLLGNETLAANNFEKAKVSGSTIIESDKYAAYALSQPLPHPEIMKLRLFTDGGYYEDAFNIIASIDPGKFAVKKDFVEYHYRQARLYHKTNDIKNAVTSYIITINKTGDSEWYFAPNAALQLGYIYFAKEELEISKDYFKLCLSYKSHPYKNSIDNKAKAGLEKIKSISD